MTETDWLASDDAGAMLRWVRGEAGVIPASVQYPISDRKLRLFAAAIYRSAQGKHYSRRDAFTSAEMTERWADEGVEPPELGLPFREMASGKWRLISASRHAESALSWCRDWMLPKATQAALLRDIVGNPFRPVMLPAGPPCRKCRGKGKRPSGAGGAVDRPSHRPCEVCEGTGHGPCPWLTPDVLALAQAAYDQRDEVSGHLDPVRLAILADSLEEVGCPPEVETACNGCGGAGVVYDEVGTDYPCVRCGRGGLTRPGTGRAIVPHPLLAHLRSPGPHVRGCWAIDLVLEKE